MKIGRIIIYSLTICFVVFLAIFMIGLHLASTRPLPPPVQEYLNGHVSAELYFEDQGAWGSYVALEISGLHEVLLGEALLRQYSLKYTYHFTNLKSINE